MAAILGRNCFLTGVPYITYMEPLISLFDIRIHYPYNIMSGINGEGGTLTVSDAIGKILLRLKSYFFTPSDESHIIIAWGTVFPVFALLSSMIVSLRKKSEDKLKRIWMISMVVLSVLFAMMKINQADGNYFLLHYLILVAVCGTVLRRYRRSGTILLSLSMIFNFAFFPISSWSWATGFSEISLNGREYSSKQAVSDYSSARYGELKYALTRDPHTKYLMTGLDVTGMCGLDAVGELFYDIAISNPAILSNAETLEQYIDQYEIQYLLMDEETTDRNYISLIEALIEKGRIDRLIVQKNDQAKPISLLQICPAGEVTGEGEKQIMEQFSKRKGNLIHLYGRYNDSWAGKEVSYSIFSETGQIHIRADEPLDFGNPVYLKIFINGKPEKTIEMKKQWDAEECSLEVPVQEHFNLLITADQSMIIGDGRECSCRLWIEVAE